MTSQSLDTLSWEGPYFQAQTDYQRMLNMRPDPTILPIFDLKTLKSTAMDFQMGMDFEYQGKVKIRV